VSGWDFATNARLGEVAADANLGEDEKKVVCDEAWMIVYHAYCSTYQHDQWAERVRACETKMNVKDTVLPIGLRCVPIGARDLSPARQDCQDACNERAVYWRTGVVL